MTVSKIMLIVFFFLAAVTRIGIAHDQNFLEYLELSQITKSSFNYVLLLIWILGHSNTDFWLDYIMGNLAFKSCTASLCNFPFALLVKNDSKSCTKDEKTIHFLVANVFNESYNKLLDLIAQIRYCIVIRNGCKMDEWYIFESIKSIHFQFLFQKKHLWSIVLQ
jgi:hypothetical protein